MSVITELVLEFENDTERKNALALLLAAGIPMYDAGSDFEEAWSYWRKLTSYHSLKVYSNKRYMVPRHPIQITNLLRGQKKVTLKEALIALGYTGHAVGTAVTYPNYPDSRGVVEKEMDDYGKHQVHWSGGSINRVPADKLVPIKKPVEVKPPTKEEDESMKSNRAPDAVVVRLRSQSERREAVEALFRAGFKSRAKDRPTAAIQMKKWDTEKYPNLNVSFAAKEFSGSNTTDLQFVSLVVLLDKLDDLRAAAARAAVMPKAQAAAAPKKATANAASKVEDLAPKQMYICDNAGVCGNGICHHRKAHEHRAGCAVSHHGYYRCLAGSVCITVEEAARRSGAAATQAHSAVSTTTAAPAANKKEKTEMKKTIIENVKNAATETVSTQKGLLVQAATLEAGSILREQVVGTIGPKLPMMLRGYAATPLGQVVMMNLVGVAIRTAKPNLASDHPILAVTDAAVVGAYQDAIKQLNIDKMLSDLFEKGPLAKAMAKLEAEPAKKK